MTPTFPSRADQAGRIVLHAALDHARQVFGAELVSACALGSLTHGSFQESVSDVDLALMLCEVTPETPAQMETVKSAVLTGQGTELAGRLSTFWSTWEALAQARRLGRFRTLTASIFFYTGNCSTARRGEPQWPVLPGLNWYAKGILRAR